MLGGTSEFGERRDRRPRCTRVGVIHRAAASCRIARSGVHRSPDPLSRSAGCLATGGATWTLSLSGLPTSRPTLKECGAAGSALDADHLAQVGDDRDEVASSVEGGSDLRGSTLLAAFMLNPWGKYIDESIHVPGYVGALEYLRSMRTAVCREDALPMDFITGAQMSCAKLARQVENNIAQDSFARLLAYPVHSLMRSALKVMLLFGEDANKGEQRRGEND